MCHNEIAGWGVADEPPLRGITPLHLRHDFEHPRLAPRYEFNEAVAATSQRNVMTIRAQGEGPIAQLFDLILFGDQVSLELASLHGQDPGPIEVLAELKHRLDE